MRTRTRLLLDLGLTAALVVAFNPAWSGIPVHQWLSIAVIAPLVVHLVVNWEWALRIVGRFFRKLLSVSRLNFVVDAALLVATVTVMLSGFMVSPALFVPFGMRFAVTTQWVVVHAWSANATMGLLAIHGVLHVKWALGAVRKLVAQRSSATALSGARVPVGRGVAARSGYAASSISPRGHRGRNRARRAAAERAVVVRTVSALGLSAVVGAAVFVSVGMAQPSTATARVSTKVAASDMRRCPVTGCTASSCHADTGVRAEAFYGKARVAAWNAKSTAGAPASSAPVVTRRVATRTPVSARTTTSADSSSKAKAAAAREAAAKRATAKRAAAAQAAAKRAAQARAAAKKAAATPVRRTCPVTGCSASTCHADHGVSARTWYATH